MKPHIDKTKFGSITIAGERFEHDVVIRLDGRIEKRRKKLSKALYGTSHIVSRAEAEHVYETGAARLIVGTGQLGSVALSDEAAAYLREQACDVVLLPVAQAITAWNEAEGRVIGLFHVTC